MKYIHPPPFSLPTSQISPSVPLSQFVSHCFSFFGSILTLSGSSISELNTE